MTKEHAKHLSIVLQILKKGNYVLSYQSVHFG